MRWPHASDRRLERWVAAKPGARSLGHVAHCTQCQDRLEQLTELEPQMRAQLEVGLSASASVERRLRERLERTLSDREALSLMTDLMNTGLRTSRLLIEGGQEEEDDGRT